MSFRTNSKIEEFFASGTLETSSTTRENPMVWARKMIAQRTNKYNVIPLFYRESLQYMISQLGSLSYINSDTKLVDVKCIHANPERAVAKMKQENNIILPIISINQNSSANADDRRRGAPQIVNDTFWSEEKKRAVRVISEAPRAVDIEYGINIWAKYNANLDQIVEQIRLLFNPHLVIKNSYTNLAQAYLDQETDKSTVETSDRQERILRRSFTVKLESYIPNPQFIITSTGEIEELKMDATIYQKK
tara:strand:- start:1784 stop:2527 length:744 start_codon:yes stop_codon:yes gene_type:complete